MKNFTLSLFSFATIFSVLFSSCETNIDETLNSNKTSNLLEIVEKNDDLSTFAAAIKKTDLGQTLSNDGSITVFAPTNVAFAEFLTDNGFTSLDAVPPLVLKEILLNHVLSTFKKESDLPVSGYLTTMATGNSSATNNISLYINKIDGNTTINGLSKLDNSGVDIGTIEKSNIIGANGVLHKVNSVINLPSILDHLTANPSFGSYLDAMTLDNQPDSFIDDLDSSINFPFTIFAPYNSAFSAYLTEYNYTNISAVPTATLTKVLQNHIVVGFNYMSNSFTNDQILTPSSLSNLKIKVNTTNGSLRVEDFQTRQSSLFIKDIQCNNGVIHAVDKVLVPNLN